MTECSAFFRPYLGLGSEIQNVTAVYMYDRPREVHY
jgi:hypothetical protein